MIDPALRWRAAAQAAASLLPLSAARAEPTIEDLLKRIEEQDQKILVLNRSHGYGRRSKAFAPSSSW